MKTKSIFALLMTLAILASCSPALQATQIPAFPTPTQIKTPTLLPTQQTAIYKHIPYKITTTVLSPTMRPITLNPIIGPSSTPLPTSIPYPTASVVKANAVAFVAQDWQNHGPSSLWVANIDGSGEKKIVDSITELENGPYWSFVAPTWSPNGKEIGYISEGDLWVVSPDGSTSRKILSLADKNKEMIYAYKWSPDGLQIAYAQGNIIDGGPQIVVGLINVATGETSEILSYQSPPPRLLYHGRLMVVIFFLANTFLFLYLI